MRASNWIIYALLVAIWISVLGWQWVEHVRVEKSAREALVVRGRDITTTLGLVLRSQRRFGSLVSQERLDPALKELVKTEDVTSIALLNKAGDVVASAGDPIDLDTVSLAQSGVHWDDDSVTLVNVMDLGTHPAAEGADGQAIIVLPRRESSGTNPPEGRPPFSWWDPGRSGTNRPEGPRGFPSTNDSNLGSASVGPPRDRGGRQAFGRPPWMSEEEFKSIGTRQGLHRFLVVLSNRSAFATTRSDAWMRSIIGLFAAAACAGLGVAWWGRSKSSDLKLRLLRASEQNKHLREMNLAAAGLAHETRNPLNIVRGLAQIISKQEDASPDIRQRSSEITNEVDRVTAQLNQFINYSKPREVKRTWVGLDRVIDDVVRALSGDLEEKAVKLSISRGSLRVEADEQLLRQMLFNLLLNAIQAVGAGAEILFDSGTSVVGEAFLEIRDTGPGVEPQDRLEIFKPYFTRRKDGTGLGLAVVHQIVLAHGWDIECLQNEPHGALFRIRHLKRESGS